MKMWPKGWRSLTLNFCWERDLAFTDSVFSVTLWAISTTNSANLLYVYVNSQKWMLVYTVYTLLYSLIFSPHNLFQKPCCAYLLSFFQRMQSSLGQLYHHWFNSLLMTVFYVVSVFFHDKTMLQGTFICVHLCKLHRYQNEKNSGFCNKYTRAAAIFHSHQNFY